MCDTKLTSNACNGATLFAIQNIGSFRDDVHALLKLNEVKCDDFDDPRQHINWIDSPSVSEAMRLLLEADSTKLVSMSAAALEELFLFAHYWQPLFDVVKSSDIFRRDKSKVYPVVKQTSVPIMSYLWGKVHNPQPSSYVCLLHLRLY